MPFGFLSEQAFSFAGISTVPAPFGLDLPSIVCSLAPIPNGRGAFCALQEWRLKQKYARVEMSYYNELVGSQNLHVDDDGLTCPDVRVWAETKYRLLALYTELFSTGMKNKWDQRVYIDLYAGAGYSHVMGTGTFLKGSPIIALTVANLFYKYTFCEEDEQLLDALKLRVRRIASQANVEYVSGSCDAKISEIYNAIPRGSSSNKVLSLCLVDPFDFGIKFETLRRLSTVFIDFVVLLAVGWMQIATTTITFKGNPRKLMKLLVTRDGANAGKPLALGREI